MFVPFLSSKYAKRKKTFRLRSCLTLCPDDPNFESYPSIPQSQLQLHQRLTNTRPSNPLLPLGQPPHGARRARRQRTKHPRTRDPVLERESLHPRPVIILLRRINHVTPGGCKSAVIRLALDEAQDAVKLRQQACRRADGEGRNERQVDQGGPGWAAAMVVRRVCVWCAVFNGGTAGHAGDDGH